MSVPPNGAKLSGPSRGEGPFRRVPRLWDLRKALSLVEGLPRPDLCPQTRTEAIGGWHRLPR